MALASLLRRFAVDRSGATSIEYGMIAVLISIVMLVALTEISGDVHGLYVVIFNAF